MLRYYKEHLGICLKLLSMLGLNPVTTTFRSKLVVVLVLLGIGCDQLCAFLFTVTSFKSSIDLILSCSIFIKVVNQVTTLIWKGPKMRTFISEMDNFWPVSYGDMDEDLQGYCLTILKSFTLVTKYTIVFIFFAVVGMAFTLYFGADVVFIRFIQRFFDDASVVPEVLDIGIAFLYATVVMGFDSLLIASMILIWMQFKIVNVNLKSLHYSDDDGAKKAVKNYISHHNFLISLFNQLNQNFGPNLLIYLWIQVSIICFSMYIISVSNHTFEETLKFTIVAFACSLEMVLLYFIPSQFLIDEANEAAQSLYVSDWYKADRSLKMSLLMIMTRGQRQNVLMAGKLMPMNFATCTGIFKTTMTFNTFLRNMRDQ